MAVSVMAEEALTPAVTADNAEITDTEQVDGSASQNVQLKVESNAALDLEPKELLEKPVMGDVAHALSPLGMYQAADWVVKLVMIVLLAASMLTWAIWLAKWLQLASARKQVKKLLGQVTTLHRFDAVHDLQLGVSAGQTLINATEQELTLSRQENAWVDEGIKQRMGARLERIQIAEAGAMGIGMGILATVGAVAPFVGLFGTVWGIMNAFIGIARSQTTNLAVVAPGIAEALLATAMGLIAAIPAVVIYNHFSRKITAYRSLLGDISTNLLILVSRDLDRQSLFSVTNKVDFPKIKKAAEVSA
ncbi:tonB-system energizer ExbB [Methylophaga nitratireducenticrescens]|uniref:Biopolymer transport protein ExbB n=2 Tax=Methylophaga nitratireducenticrescens TaxID=754476 RepID=I1XML9_METNJ|nr:tonB-system energizer ExbB [Methylophaga nitratireducenticrescens]AUZ86083.1 tonB-system energizer ExbB [Methylophaga nitratireducenticrescens]